jgi:sulfur carrier protein
MVTIRVNGEPREVPGEWALARVLGECLDIKAEPGVAVAVNGEVVRRRDWDSVQVAAGDALEIVRAVQGG